MEKHCRNEQMERELQEKIDASLAARYGGAVPADVQERVAAEMRHVIGNGHGTLLAAAAKLAEFSTERGYPVGIRGLIGNLYVAYLLGIAAVDPLKLGLPWEGCLGRNGNRMPVITLNIAPELLEDMTAYLAEILPWYDPDDEQPAIRLCPHPLMGLAGEARRQAGTRPRHEDIFDEGLVARAYHGNVSGVPVLGDLDGFQDFSRALGPKTFRDMVKIVGLCLASEIRFQAERLSGQPDTFANLIGTREDVYDLCVQHGIDEGNAFAIMQQVCRGSSGRLTQEYKDMIGRNSAFSGLFLDTLDSIGYLYPRGQCADYLYWALTVLWYRK
ncbi:MAG: hypothetical protein K2O11_11575 [Oscillospiraceae bacterium]|nr:hypothetical protein [Oscillospiraceae bacterium]